MYLKGEFIKFIKFIILYVYQIDNSVCCISVAVMSRFQIWVGAFSSWGTKNDLQSFLLGRGVDYHLTDISFDTGILIAIREVCVLCEKILTKIIML